MAIAVRHRMDRAPDQQPLPGLAVAREESAAVMAALQDRAASEMTRRFDAGHRAYVARVNGDAAGWGWVATRSAEIGELALTFDIPARNRYLWNFVTLPSHRGKGVYPRLIEAIVRAESSETEQFWIAYAPENRASASGIAKAGFVTIAELSFNDALEPALRSLIPGGGLAASRMFGIPEASEELRQCWRCVRAGRSGMRCESGACSCDYQQPRSGCAAAAYES
jgi:GNAT superfamily N-acetyltransferase